MSNPVAISLTVDDLYDMMDAGQCQHMANKLFKHGYVSPKAPKPFSIDTSDADKVVDQLAFTMSMASLMQAIQKKYPATVARVVFQSMMKEGE